MDKEWERIKGYFEGMAYSKTGRPRDDDLQMLNEIPRIARSGASRRNLPERYGT